MKRDFEKTIRTHRNTKKPSRARFKTSTAKAIVVTSTSRKSAVSVCGSGKAGGGVGSRRSSRATRATGKMVQIAPTLFVSRDAKPPASELVLCNVVHNGDGFYRLEPRTWERFERVNGGLSRKLGLGSRTDTLRRLIRGGFVGGARIAPKLYTINLESYWAHYDRCAEDLDYWSNPKVRTEYWTAI